MARVVVFGSLNMDLSLYCEPLPRAGETVTGRDFVMSPGGKGANQAVAASRLGARTFMVGAVGDDAFSAPLVESLAGSGVDVSGVRVLGGAASGSAVILRSGSDNRIVVNPGANHGLSPDEAVSLIEAVAEPGDCLLLQLECDPAAVEAAVLAGRRLGLYVMLNPAPAMPMDPQVLSSVDCVCMNETECEALCGVLPHTPDEAVGACRSLVSRGVHDVVVTLGDQGSAAVSGAFEGHVPARAVPVVDTTAAGDTFIGSLAASHAAGVEFPRALEVATVAASLAVGHMGAQPSIPTAAEVEVAL